MTTTVSSSCEKVYDLVLFGVTGFTGKLAAEYLLRHYYNSANTTSCDTDDATKDKDAVTITDHKPKLPVLSWAVCARNESKAREILETLIQQIVEDDEGTERTTMTKNDITKSDNITASTSTATATKTTTNTTTTVRQHRMVPPIVVADLQCTTTEQRVQLDRIVQQTKVVITCAGPFELYGPALVQACVTQGVHYADITGESDFFRQMIQQYDDRARQNHAAILCHCGADCIPQTVMVYEMHRFCQQRYGSVNDPASMIPQLYQVVNYIEWSQSTRMSGGTAATAVYQLGKPRPPKKKKNNNNNTNKEAEGKDNDKSDDSNDYDPLLKRVSYTQRIVVATTLTLMHILTIILILFFKILKKFTFVLWFVYILPFPLPTFLGTECALDRDYSLMEQNLPIQHSTFHPNKKQLFRNWVGNKSVPGLWDRLW